ncbi:MAG: hypothetical protein ACRDWY_07940 [Actinomycetes bacterium]
MLQLVNRALAKVQRPHHFEAAMVTVTRVHDREVVVQEEAPTTAEAFQRAEAIVSQIEAGTFRG